MVFKQKCQELYNGRHQNLYLDTAMFEFLSEYNSIWCVYFYGLFSWTSLTKVFLLNPRHDFISYCFLPSRPATLQWLDPACLCVEFCKPKYIKWVMPVLVLACARLSEKLLPQLSTWGESASLISASLYLPVLTDNCWDDAGPAPENHSNQPKSPLPSRTHACPSLNSLDVLEDRREPILWWEKGKGSKPRKDAGKYFGGTKWEGSGQRGSKWWIKFLSSASWNKKIKQGKFGSQRWMVNNVKPARISTLYWRKSSDRLRKLLS